MPTFRDDIDALQPYVPGRSFDEIRRVYQLDDVIRLASNESPEPPFPEVVDRIASLAAGVNRYPETVYTRLGAAVAADVDVAPENLWFGGGGAQLLFHTAMTTGGPGHSAVYAWPSFVMYRLATMIAHAEPIEVLLDADQRHDLAAMRLSIRDDTTVVYVCNPNNPTGTHVSAGELQAFVDYVPDTVLIVVDEAYRHYVAADDYLSLATMATQRQNLTVLHTFSKIYGLAGLRIGYMVGHPDTLDRLRRSQPPFTVSALAQEAAIEALHHPERLRERVERSDIGRATLVAGLRDRGFEPADSQTNFVYFEVDDAAAVTEQLLRNGVIVRPMGPRALRVSVGTPGENQSFLEAMTSILAAG